MLRFLVFGGDVGNPKGGYHDFWGSFDEFTSAEACVADFHTEGSTTTWFHVVDSIWGHIVKESGKD